MNLETKKEKICINQIIGQKKENIEIEGDVIIPDIKPDILKCINTSGNICIYKKEVTDGKVRIDGAINVNIIYLADDEKSSVRGITSTIDFSKVIEINEAKQGMLLDSKIKLNDIECRILNGRKVSLKALADVCLTLSINDDVELIQSCENIDDIQVLNKNLNINSLVGRQTATAQAKDTILIDGIDNLSEILKTNVDVINIETKKSYNKVLIKSDLNVKIMYLTDDGRVGNVESKIPVMGFVDMPDIADDDICEVSFDIKNIVIKPNSVEEHSIYIDAEIEFTCSVFQNKEAMVIEDLYSPCKSLNCKQKMINTMQGKREKRDICSIREKQIIQEIKNEKIYDMDVSACIKKQSILKDRILFDGDLSIKFVYSKANSIESKTIIIPFNYNMECEGVDSNSCISTNIEIQTQDAIIMPDDSVELKIDLNFTAFISKNVEVNVIDDINIEENTDNELYSIIIYFVKPGDTLWKLAKKFKSTVSDIAELNGIEDESNIVVGQQLFIPRYVTNKKCLMAKV